jgi:alpha-D-xyloside xylohydrolase
MQYTTEKPDAPYKIYIYPGADASFTVYEDDNETYAYEKGQRATFDLHWNDAKRILLIGKRKGTFPQMVNSRELKVILVGGNKDLANEPKAKTIHYSGRVAAVKF